MDKALVVVLLLALIFVVSQKITDPALRQILYLVLVIDPTWRQGSNCELARQAGVHHQLVGRLRKEVAMDDSSREPHTGRSATQHQAHPSPRTPLLMGEVLTGCGLSPAWIQRLFSRLAAMPPTQRRQAGRLLVLAWAQMDGDQTLLGPHLLGGGPSYRGSGTPWEKVGPSTATAAAVLRSQHGPAYITREDRGNREDGCCNA
jgi:hypothetical protein